MEKGGQKLIASVVFLAFMLFSLRGSFELRIQKSFNEPVGSVLKRVQFNEYNPELKSYGGVLVSTGFVEVNVSTSRLPLASLKSGNAINANIDEVALAAA